MESSVYASPTSTPDDRMEALFRPASIALVGASPDIDKISGRPFHFLERFGYQGSLYPVNPKYDELYGLAAYGSVLDIPLPPDLAIVTVPAGGVKDAVHSCIEAGVRSLIVYTGGFAEYSEEGAAIERDLGDEIRPAGVRLLGPNCQGYANLRDGICTTFNAAFAHDVTSKGGNVAWVAQSGALGGAAFRLLEEAGVGLSHWVSTGNELDLTVAECISHFLEDDAIELACGYVEGVRDPMAFLSMGERARELDKLVVLIKGGTTAAGGRATQTHTGRLSSDGAVYRGLFEQAGVVMADSLQDLVAIVTVAAKQGRSWRQGRVAVISNSGGMNALIADKCHDAGLTLPSIGPDTADRVAELLPPFIKVSNPVDLQQGVYTDPERVAGLIRLLHDAGTHNTFAVALHSVYDDLGYDSEALIRSLASLGDAGFGLIVIPFNCQKDFVSRARSAGLVVFEDVGNIGAALSALSGTGPADRSGPPAPTLPLRLLSQADSRRLLEANGIGFGQWSFASSVDEATRAAEAAGFPVAVKVEGVGIGHKSDIGGVALGISSITELETAFELVTEAGRQAGSSVTGVIVEGMAPDGVEVAVGMRRMADLGVVLMFGLGGVLVELLEDVAFRVAPLDQEGAERMVESIKGAALLKGYRGAAPADTGALAQLLVALGRFALDHPEVAEVDLNPVVVLPASEGVVNVDAVVAANG